MIGLELTEREEKQVQATSQTTNLELPGGYLSNSRIQMYQACPEAFRRTYVDGVRSPSNPKMAVGKSVHALVERALKGKMLGSMPSLEQSLDEASEVVANEFVGVEVNPGDSDSPDPAANVDKVRRLFKTWMEVRASSIVPLGVEEEFNVMVNGVPVKGIIDLVDGAHGKKTVVDLKVTGRKKTERDLRNSLQLSLYSYVKKTPYVGFDSIVNKEVPSVEIVRGAYSPEEMQWPAEVVLSTAKAISAGVFPHAAPDSWKCSKEFCSFWKDCRGKSRT